MVNDFTVTSKSTCIVRTRVSYSIASCPMAYMQNFFNTPDTVRNTYIARKPKGLKPYVDIQMNHIPIGIVELSNVATTLINVYMYNGKDTLLPRTWLEAIKYQLIDLHTNHQRYSQYNIYLLDQHGKLFAAGSGVTPFTVIGNTFELLPDLLKDYYYVSEGLLSKYMHDVATKNKFRDVTGITFSSDTFIWGIGGYLFIADTNQSDLYIGMQAINRYCDGYLSTNLEKGSTNFSEITFTLLSNLLRDSLGLEISRTVALNMNKAFNKLKEQHFLPRLTTQTVEKLIKKSFNQKSVKKSLLAIKVALPSKPDPKLDENTDIRLSEILNGTLLSLLTTLTTSESSSYTLEILSERLIIDTDIKIKDGKTTHTILKDSIEAMQIIDTSVVEPHYIIVAAKVKALLPTMNFFDMGSDFFKATGCCILFTTDTLASVENSYTDIYES